MIANFTVEYPNKLNILTKVRAVELLQIPRHNGIRSNKIADVLKRLGTRQPLIDPEPAGGIFNIQI